MLIVSFFPQKRDGWLDNVGYYPTNPVGKFLGNYIVPSGTPDSDGQYLYYFIGAENLEDGELSILQPVSFFQKQKLCILKKIFIGACLGNRCVDFLQVFFC